MKAISQRHLASIGSTADTDGTCSANKLTEELPEAVRTLPGKQCCRCRERPRAGKHRYCLPCHAAYMRAYRRMHGLPASQRKKAICRAYTNVLLGRGLIQRAEACEKCGSGKRLEKHHPNYNDPWTVRWWCRTCHLAYHAARRAAKRQGEERKAA